MCCYLFWESLEEKSVNILIISSILSEVLKARMKKDLLGAVCKAKPQT